MSEETPPHNWQEMGWHVANKWGFHTLLLLAAVWFMWETIEGYRLSSNAELEALRSQIKEDRDYIRGEFSAVIDRNTEAFIDLKQEISTMRKP